MSKVSVDKKMMSNYSIGRKGIESMTVLNDIDLLVSTASIIPLTSKVMVDAESLFSLIERFREVFPKELEEAESVLGVVEEIAQEAEMNADNIVENAIIKSKDILNESRILKEARESATVIIEEARKEASFLIEEARELKRKIEEEAMTLKATIEEEAKSIIEETTKTKGELESEAEAFICSLFKDAEANLLESLSSVREGLSSMK